MSKYVLPMVTDNTISLIGRVYEFANQFILEKLHMQGIDGIVPSHGAILVNLIRNKEMTLTNIAHTIRRDRSTVTTSIKKLEGLGYVQTFSNEADKRSTVVRLTAKGKKLIPAFEEISEALFAQTYRGFNRADREAFRALLQRILHNLVP